ncbi:hypothetical protein [Amycolatopsis sp. WGS_07]
MPENTTDDHDHATPPPRPAGWPKPLADLADQRRPPATPKPATDDD